MPVSTVKWEHSLSVVAIGDRSGSVVNAMDKPKFHLARQSRLDTTRHVWRVEPMHFGCIELVEQHGSTCSSRRARHVERVRVVSRRDVTWRDSMEWMDKMCVGCCMRNGASWAVLPTSWRTVCTRSMRLARRCRVCLASWRTLAPTSLSFRNSVRSFWSSLFSRNATPTNNKRFRFVPPSPFTLTACQLAITLSIFSLYAYVYIFSAVTFYAGPPLSPSSTKKMHQRLCSRLAALWRCINFVLLLLLLLNKVFFHLTAYKMFRSTTLCVIVLSVSSSDGLWWWSWWCRCAL